MFSLGYLVNTSWRKHLVRGTATRTVTVLGSIGLIFCSYAYSDSVNEENPRPVEEITVVSERLHQNFDNNPAPILGYDKNFFQTFEPLSVGDMLKRVSSVSFSGDAAEFSAPQLRGLASQYTQVLINGRRVPGSAADRSALVDRIPAELIESIQIIRSATADIDSQGIAGTLNFILKDVGVLQTSNWRLGGLYYSDLPSGSASSIRGTASITHGGAINNLDYSLSANLQQRLSPKTKTERVLNGEGELDHTINATVEKITRDDAFSGIVGFNFSNGSRLTIESSWAQAEIDEDEIINVFDDEFELDHDVFESESIHQDRIELNSVFTHQLSKNIKLQFDVSLDRFDETSFIHENFNSDENSFVQLLQSTSIENNTVSWGGSLSWALRPDHEVQIGLGLKREYRKSRQTLLEFDDEEGELVDDSLGNGFYRVEEELFSAYLKDSWSLSQNSTIEFGARMGESKLQQRGGDGKDKNSHFDFNPSVHFIYQLNDYNQFRLSVAKTIRRPGFDEIIPFTNTDTPNEDQVTIGNPDLRPELAWGADLGYQHQFQSFQGNYGVNLFYREIEDKIELTRIEDDRFTPDNVGRGNTWGFEIDVSASLSFVHLPSVNVFANATWLDSEIKDPYTGTKRRFNLQSNFIANIDVIQHLPSLGLSHGLSVQKQGQAGEFLANETKTISYGANLEYFVEKTLGENKIIRFSANNILGSRKKDHSLIYNGLAELQSGELDESIFEIEESTPVFLITFRGSF